MIKINLLPHREAKRKQNKNAFYRMLGLAGAFGFVIFVAVATFFVTRISDQDSRNTFIKSENDKLDQQIKEIASLKQDIDALKARQQAVEDLQSDRNQPVYLMDELVKQVPEGMFLHSFKQEGQKVSLSGSAMSNERVSELLHNLTYSSQWLEKPDLIEIRSGTIGQGKDVKKVFEFTMAVGIKRPRDKDKAGSDNKSGSGGATASADSAGRAADKAPAPTDKPSGSADKVVPAADKASAPDSKIAAGKAASDAGGPSSASDAPKKP
jgi:type IV pilus assembly protein PilN